MRLRRRKNGDKADINDDGEYEDIDDGDADREDEDSDELVIEVVGEYTE